MASKHRDIGLKFRYRSTPNTRRVTKNVGFGGGVPYIYICTLLYYSSFHVLFHYPRILEQDHLLVALGLLQFGRLGQRHARPATGAERFRV